MVFSKTVFLLWVAVAFVLIALVNNSVISVAAGQTIYDFVDHASEAQWSSGAGALPFPGDPSDSRGFARYVYNARLEDDSTWSKVLETHPQRVSGGWIMGVYPQQTVPANSQLTVRVGFLAGATGTDGVKFDVYFDEYRGLNVAPLRHTIISKVVDFDGKLDAITSDLSSLAGKKGNFILRVYAGKTSERDWAVWAEAKIEAKPLPDLVVTDVWESGGVIRYKVKNIGNAVTATKSFCNCLYVDGKQVAKHCIVQVLQPSQEVEGVFNYAWQPTPGEHVVKVCADCDQSVEESNEGNNCLEEKWMEEKLPDLVVTEIKFDADKSLIGYMLKNRGSEVAKGGHSTTLYVDGREVAHDLVDVDLSPGGTHESWFKDYKVSGKTSIKVKVCADNYNQVKESNEKNNCLERVLDLIPPTVTVTHAPADVTWFDKVTFTATATDDTEVTRIAIYLNGTRVKECISPLRSIADGKYHCAYEGGPFQAGILNVTAEAFDPAGNRGVCEEDINVTVRLYLPPIIRPPRLCRITGKIYNFPYNPDTLKIKVCEAEQVCAYRINPFTREQLFECNCQCKMVSPTPERLGAGWTYSWMEYADVSRTGESQTYEYSIALPCNGMYLLEPVYSPCPGGLRTPECECIWRGTWNASKAFCVRMDGENQEGYDFTFNPLDTTVPSITIQFSNDHPRVGDDVEVIVTAIDNVKIEYITLSLIEIMYANGSRGVPTGYQFPSSAFAEHSLHPEQYPWIHRVVVRWKIPWKDVYKITFEAWACDRGGNVGILPPQPGVNRKTLEFGCPEITFEFENGGGLMRSNFPIFGLPDEDEDGLCDCWENAAMDASKPYIELDENERLRLEPYDKVVFFVRVTPYPDRANPKYILFYYVTTWSKDYGRSIHGFGHLEVPPPLELIFETHDGDTEPVVMAWRVGADKRTVQLEYVYIEAHGKCCKREDLWSAYGESCNTAPYCNFQGDEVAGYKTLCSSLQFIDNRLLLYASEGKHALYPSCHVCENVWLTKADVWPTDECLCASAESFGDCFKDFIACIINFVAGLVRWVYDLLKLLFWDWWQSEGLGAGTVAWDYLFLLDLCGDSTHGHVSQRLVIEGDTDNTCPCCDGCYYRYWVEYSVDVDIGPPYSRERPHVLITVSREHCDKNSCDLGSDEIEFTVTGFSIHQGGQVVDVWRVAECRDDSVDDGDDFWMNRILRGEGGGHCTRSSSEVVFEGEIDESYIIGFVVSLTEHDPDNTEGDLNRMGEEWKSKLEEKLRSRIEIPTCEESLTGLIYGFFTMTVGEDCGGATEFRRAGARPGLYKAYNVGEPWKLVLNNLDGSERALGGKELAVQDRFPGESIEGLICSSRDRVFCGGTGSHSCGCASSVLQMMGVKWNKHTNNWELEIPQKLNETLKARLGGGG